MCCIDRLDRPPSNLIVPTHGRYWYHVCYVYVDRRDKHRFSSYPDFAGGLSFIHQGRHLVSANCSISPACSRRARGIGEPAQVEFELTSKRSPS